jgi:hypothetical protein
MPQGPEFEKGGGEGWEANRKQGHPGFDPGICNLCSYFSHIIKHVDLELGEIKGAAPPLGPVPCKCL